MPELIEVEAYRQLAERTVGRVVSDVYAPDGWFIKGEADASCLSDLLVGASIVDARRHGKLLMIGTDRSTVLGMRFGMTGRLVLHRAQGVTIGTPRPSDLADDPVGRLLYTSGRDRAEHCRFGLVFVGGERLTVIDPRRLGAVMLDPAVDNLGPDVVGLAESQLSDALCRSTASLKSVLMNQQRIAGLGNLLTDETLWRARLSPLRRADSLSAQEQSLLLRALGETVEVLSDRGGSHTGDLQPARQRGARCPRCGEPLRRDTVGGRTTYWCPSEQR